MVYNETYHFLFVHIQKTAGTSITQALVGLAGSQFIAPPHLRLRDIRLKSASRPLIFTVVRNPWERMVSWYEMMLRKGMHNDFSRHLLRGAGPGNERVDFSTYIRRTDVIRESDVSELASTLLGRESESIIIGNHYLKSLGFNQLDYISDAEGRVCCDRVLRFERLEEDWKELCGVLKLPGALELPRENANPTPKPWRDSYTGAADRDWVAHLYARDIAHFGYRFEA